MHRHADEVDFPGDGPVGRIIGVATSPTESEGSISRKVVGTEPQRLCLRRGQEIHVRGGDRIHRWQRAARGKNRRVIRCG